jgi:Reverse transcriptase (RNA-dependent DNA polymerase)
VLKRDIINLFASFYEDSIDLRKLNKANIIMLPKREGAVKLSDYRPISIINLFPKLLSKVLANRLSKELPNLISVNQTAFMRGRHISENFIAMREILHHIHSTKASAVFMKIDFSKAFDSVNWSFLMAVMKARGFTDRWMQWMHKMLTSSSSRLMLNGEVSQYFKHKRGATAGRPPLPPAICISC